MKVGDKIRYKGDGMRNLIYIFIINLVYKGVD
jgi:hypothetical protein